MLQHRSGSGLKNSTPIEIYTYFRFTDFFRDIISPELGLSLPISILSNEDQLDKNIKSRIKNLDRVEPICFSAFLNMISQTQGIEYALNQSVIELEKLNINTKKRGLLFHRNNLLYLIGLKILDNCAGNMIITGNRVSN